MAEDTDVPGLVLKSLKLNPRGLTITDLAKKLHKDRNSIARCLNILKAEGRVESKTIGSAHVYWISQRIPLSAFLCFTRNMILIVDENLNIVQANEHFIRFCNMKKEDLIGRHIIEDAIPVVSSPESVATITSPKGDHVMTEIRYSTDKKDLFFKMEVIQTIFDEGDTGLTLILEDITDTKKYLKNIEFLAHTAMELVDLPSDANIYEYIADRVSELLPKPPRTWVVSYDPIRNGYMIESIRDTSFFECSKQLNNGNDVSGLVFPIQKYMSKPPYYETVETMKIMREFPFRPFFPYEPVQFYDICNEVFSREACEAFIVQQSIGKMCIAGLAWQNKLFGFVGMCLHPGEELENHMVIESFIRQASIAIARRRTQDCLNQSESRFLDVMGYMGNPVLITDYAGGVRYLNPSFTSEFGYTLDDIPEWNTWVRNSCPDNKSRELLMQMYERLPESASPGFMCSVQCKDYSLKRVHIRCVASPDGMRTVIFRNSSDISPPSGLASSV
ncbi:PAS domain S-box protein [Methanospirillum hungatei]|uniref:PAS domain S-box protein n=1 Tax=Methanospirillum hungatei TaxID=2203 RepID=UPI0026EDD532|nr:PAS domain S-box protein [Methanospirillum hungatei]MCA1916338.1 PAS domain S-box protein [Methanospirillum hungatei]